MIEVSFSDGATVYLANLATPSRDLVARPCGRCGIWFTQPFGIIRGPQGETVVGCVLCKEAQP